MFLPIHFSAISFFFGDVNDSWEREKSDRKQKQNKCTRVLSDEHRYN